MKHAVSISLEKARRMYLDLDGKVDAFGVGCGEDYRMMN